MHVYQLILTGVGGQGTLSLSRIIALAAVYAGYDVKVGESLGMSQRFGTVISFVRIGKEAYSPLPCGRANAIISMEPLETLRVWRYIGGETLVILNTRCIPPVTSSLSILPSFRIHRYPEVSKIIAILRNRTKRVIEIDGYKVLALRRLSVKTLNTLLLGILASQPENPIDVDHYRRAIAEVLSPKSVDIGLKAFELGMEIGKAFR